MKKQLLVLGISLLSSATFAQGLDVIKLNAPSKNRGVSITEALQQLSLIHI